MIDLDLVRENRRLRDSLRLERERADAYLESILALLEGDYLGMTPWARTIACTTTNHPVRESDGLCYCDPRRVAGRRGGRAWSVDP